MERQCQRNTWKECFQEGVAAREYEEEEHDTRLEVKRPKYDAMWRGDVGRLTIPRSNSNLAKPQAQPLSIQLFAPENIITFTHTLTHVDTHQSGGASTVLQSYVQILEVKGVDCLD